MTLQRWRYLMRHDEEVLTEADLAEGWHWCSEFDGLLVGPGMYELNFCKCWPNSHPVYLTAPAEQNASVQDIDPDTAW